MDNNQNINISFRYDKREKNDILDAAKRQINRKLAKQIDKSDNYDIWLINYGGRLLFIDRKTNNFYYAEQLYAIKEAIKQYNRNYGENDNINEKNILNAFFKRNKVFKIIFNYYSGHEEEINNGLLFM